MNAKELIDRYKTGERDFRGTCLRGENLAWAVLPNIDLRASDLRETNLSGADLSGANLSEGVNLTFSNLSRTDLRNVDLRDANLIGASLDSAKLENVLYNSTTQFPKGFDRSRIKILSTGDEYHQITKAHTIELIQESEVFLDKVKEIYNYLDPNSQRYGRLLNWQNSSDPFWHYGIGLSDLYIFDTGRGLQSFERQDAKFVEGIESIAFSPQQTVERLTYACHVFGSWSYSTLGWNCEHLARLIATDEARCYQSQFLWWLSDLTPNGEHKTARQIFREYLCKEAPHLNR
ncbi:MAG: pentapeptide repeat-containing protein [Thermosynechococcaceae cyanobacterium MS004]|nr:pentapeptide repeat-containing protein [Thermosynechococcaceae cyanobacterium MS004]